MQELNMIHLKEGSLLQEGRYRIEKVLGQGGFGVTYLGVQVGLHRKVAIKEFFMKDYCNRNEETCHVSVPFVGSKVLVERFKQKFVKEARTISELNHSNFIRIYDVFEENGTAYYVMEYHGHGSLADLVKYKGRLDEPEAIGYIRQIADALRYIHERKINHLDVKPSNVLLNDNGHVVLIDFGMSKRYDDDGEQTTTTPVGVSHGYAPLEQYKKGGVSVFSPATDIYSLGATLYKLLTAITPPDATEMHGENVLIFTDNILAKTRTVIINAMQPFREDRPQNIDELLKMWMEVPIAENDSEKTCITFNFNSKEKEKKVAETSSINWGIFLVRKSLGIILVLGIIAIVIYLVNDTEVENSNMTVAPIVNDTVYVIKQDSSVLTNRGSKNVKEDTFDIFEPLLTIKTLCNNTDLSAATTKFKDGDDFYLYLKSTADIYVAVFMEDKDKLFQLLPYQVQGAP